MKFLLSMFAAAFTLSFGAVQVAQAATMADGTYADYSRAGRTDIGLNVSGTVADDSELDDGLFIGGNMSHGFNEWFALGAEVAWHDTSTESDDLSAIPVLVDAIFRMAPLSDLPLVPYGVLGAGVIIFDYDRDDVSLSNLDDDIDASFTVKAGGGVDWFLNEHWIVNFEAAYYFTEEDVELTNTTRGDLDFWTVGGGVKYVF